MTLQGFTLVKLDIDALYNEAEAAGRFGACACCDEEHTLCWCGVCFKYCHDDYAHEPLFDPMEWNVDYAPTPESEF